MCKKNFEANDGRTYTLVIPDEGDRISAELCGNEVGYIALDYISEEYKRPGDYYYITDLAMNRCKGIGIGEEALRFHKEIFDTPIVAAPEHGPKMQDGSHLIDDGLPGFYPDFTDTSIKRHNVPIRSVHDQTKKIQYRI